MPAGRPSGYDPSICKGVVELGREGMGKAEIAYELDISRPTLDDWMAKHEEFHYAVTRALGLSAGWWAKQGRLGIHSREFNSNAYSLQVRNRFPGEWRDKQVQQHTGNITVMTGVPPRDGEPDRD